jgi:flagellar motor switch protein FliG
MKKSILSVFILLSLIQNAGAAPSTLEVKKRGEDEIKHVVEPILEKYCKDQCRVIHVETEVDLAVDDLVTPGFDENAGKVSLAPAAGKVKLLMDENLGSKTRIMITDLLKEHLLSLNYPVEIESKLTKFPQPASSTYKTSELREKVTREIKGSITSLLAQFCSKHCVLGEFDVQTEVVNPEDVDYSHGQDFFQDGPSAIRVKGVRASIMVDEVMPPSEVNGIVEMAKLKVSAFRGSEVTSQMMKFPKNAEELNSAIAMGKEGSNYGRIPSSLNNSDLKELNDTKELRDSKEFRDSRELKDSKESKNQNNSTNDQVTKSESGKRTEHFEKYEKIERVENGDAVQKTLEKFRMYGIIISAIILALLCTLVVTSFRKQIFTSLGFPGAGGDGKPAESKITHSYNFGGVNDPSLTADEKGALIARRIEANNLYNELINIFGEQPKVAKHVFTNILTEEGVEEVAQYLEMFGESVVMDLLKDPGLQTDCAELMDFYTKNTFDLTEDEKLGLLKRLHHRTTTAKMQIYGSRSATLFDFLAEMESAQITDMIKNESITVKAIVLTQCDQKKRQAVYHSYDEASRLKLMTELSRIDHLPKNYIFNVASALRRKKAENPKYNTEALPGSDVLVSFLEKSGLETQKSIIQQLMSSSSGDALHALKSKLASLESIRYMKDIHVTEIATSLKHDELVQFIRGTSDDIRNAFLTKISHDLAIEISEEVDIVEPVGRESFVSIERKVLNKIKNLANQGTINLAEVNEKMFANEFGFDSTGEIEGADMKRVG